MYRRIYLFCLLLPLAMAAKAQNADSLYAEARRLAFDDKEYTQAIVLAKAALAASPAYTDILVFTGRLYAWNKQPDSARFYFKSAIAQKPDMEDAYAAYADVELWNDSRDTALAIVQRGLAAHPASVPLLLRRAKVLYALRDFEAAIKTVDTVLHADRNNTDARRLAAQIRDNISKNRIGVKYDRVSFDKQFPDPWQLVSIDYTRQTRVGAFTARVNYANRFKTDGLQYEVEAYPIFSRTFYGYVNFAYSDNVGVFPQRKAGASLYANLPAAFEAEAGVRYLYFSSDVMAYTLYAGKYYKSFLFGARAFITPINGNRAQAYNLTARYYYGGIDDYVGLNLGTGISPDDRRINIQLDNVYRLRSYTAEVLFRHAIRKLNIITANVSVLNQEYLPNMVGNQLQLGLGYIRRF